MQRQSGHSKLGASLRTNFQENKSDYEEDKFIFGLRPIWHGATGVNLDQEKKDVGEGGSSQNDGLSRDSQIEFSLWFAPPFPGIYLFPFWCIFYAPRGKQGRSVGPINFFSGGEGKQIPITLPQLLLHLQGFPGFTTTGAAMLFFVSLFSVLESWEGEQGYP